MYRCDRCSEVYDDKPHKRDRSVHLCSRKCLDASHRKGDMLHDKIQTSIRERHGDDHHVKHMTKMRAKSHTSEAMARKRETFLARYGVETAVEIPRVRQQCLEAAASPESVQKRKQTTRERFGVDSVLSIPEVHALANTPEKCQQRHETMKRNGTYFTSKPEDEMYTYLVQKYGEVERQVSVNGWPIDFYVKSVDTYVQFDGEYWHGLNRSLDEIRQFKTPRDKTILRKYEIDREQERWFAENKMKLIRITDKQFSRGERAGL